MEIWQMCAILFILSSGTSYAISTITKSIYQAFDQV